MSAMKKLVLGILLGMATVGMTACSYKQGTEVNQATISKFQVGKTTKDEIISALGVPQKMTADGTDQWLTYSYTEINSLGGNKDESTAFIVNKDGVLKNIVKGKGDGGDNPLIKAAM